MGAAAVWVRLRGGVAAAGWGCSCGVGTAAGCGCGGGVGAAAVWVQLMFWRDVGARAAGWGGALLSSQALARTAGGGGMPPTNLAHWVLYPSVVIVFIHV